MANAARHAHLAGLGGRPLTAGVICLGLMLAPVPIYAAPDPGTPPGPATAAPEVAPEPEPEPEATPKPEPEAAPIDDPLIASPRPEVSSDADEEAEDDGASDLADDEPDEAADSTEDPEAAPPSATAEPLPPMQTAAWWTMFGAFAIGTTAGVLAGLAERQEDRATRLSTLFDAQTGSQPLYADRQAEYEDYLRRGEAYAAAAIGVGAVAGAATITAITLFAIDARRQRAERAATSARVRILPRVGGVKVRF